MTELREQLADLRRVHRTVQYPGDLALELLGPADSHALSRSRQFRTRSGWLTVVGGLASAAAVLAISARLMVPHDKPADQKPTKLTHVDPPPLKEAVALLPTPAAGPSEGSTGDIGLIGRFADAVEQVVTAFPPRPTINVGKRMPPGSIVPTSLDSANLLRLAPLPSYKDLRLDVIWPGVSPADHGKTPPARQEGTPTSQESA